MATPLSPARLCVDPGCGCRGNETAVTIAAGVERRYHPACGYAIEYHQERCPGLSLSLVTVHAGCCVDLRRCPTEAEAREASGR